MALHSHATTPRTVEERVFSAASSYKEKEDKLLRCFEASITLLRMCVCFYLDNGVNSVLWLRVLSQASWRLQLQPQIWLPAASTGHKSLPCGRYDVMAM